MPKPAIKLCIKAYSTEQIGTPTRCLAVILPGPTLGPVVMPQVLVAQALRVAVRVLPIPAVAPAPPVPPPALVRPQVIGRVVVVTPRATGIAVRPIVVGLKMYPTMLKLCPPVA